MTGRWLSGLLLGIALTLATPVHAGESRSTTFQGVERLFYLHGTVETNESSPLIVYLHGYRKKEEALAARSDLIRLTWGSLNALADDEGFLVAYPAAYYGRWSMFEGLRDTTLEDGRMVDDVGFIFHMVEQLVDQGLANPQRIYLSGFSDGAIMSYKVLCLADTPFAAAAPMGGSMYHKHRDDCAAKSPPPLMVIAGTNDRILPYDGWLFPTGREISIPETMEHFRLLHGCTGQDTRLFDDRDATDNSRVREYLWTGCAREGAVKLLRVEGGGHTRPSYEPVSEDWRDRAGGHNQDIESAEEVWRFLSQFRKLAAQD